MTSRREERIVRAQAQELVLEAEDLLTGRFPDRFSVAREVPSWVRLNRLAHGDFSAVSDLAEGVGCDPRSTWDAAMTYLAGEVLAAAPSGAELVALQRTRLIPLELDLIVAPEAARTPAELIRLVGLSNARERARRAHPAGGSSEAATP